MTGMMYRLLICLGTAVLLAACQQQNWPVYKGYKMKPYTLKGVQYTPMSVQEALHYQEEGIASHYEAGGARGAIGQRLYRRQLYAAHRTLPLPCVARVTNLANGKSCKVAVRDRGPYVDGRLIDVSTAAADKLGFTRKGLERVRVEVLSVGDGPYKRTK